METVNSFRTLPMASFSSRYRQRAQAGIFHSPPSRWAPPQPISVSITERTAEPVSKSSRTFCRRTLCWLSSPSSSSSI